MAEHYCKIHETVFFKKGKMPGYAHPVKNDNGETIGWCNEPKEGDTPPVEKTESVPPAQVVEKPGEPKPEIAPQERGMWWKEVGENFRAGLFKKDEGNGKILWDKYVKQMTTSLEINFKEVQPGKKLIEEAKRLGATEVEGGKS